jgi:hypothetical protein
VKSEIGEENENDSLPSISEKKSPIESLIPWLKSSVICPEIFDKVSLNSLIIPCAISDEVLFIASSNSVHPDKKIIIVKKNICFFILLKKYYMLNDYKLFS